MRWLGFLRLFGVLILCYQTSPLLAQAKYTVDISAFYLNLGESRTLQAGDGSTYTRTTTTTHQFYGLGFCYVSGIWCFGAKYMAGEREAEISDSNSNSTGVSTIELSGYGVTVGYQGQQAMAHATYLFSAEKRLGDTDAAALGGDTRVEYPASMAYILDLGYAIPLQGVRIGPLLRITHFEYKERTVSGQSYSLDRTEKDDFIVPHFALWLDL